MRISGVSLVIATVAILAGGNAMGAEQCALKLITSVDMVPDQNGRPIIPVDLNGRPKYLLIDTGGYRSILNRATADELGLARRSTGAAYIVGIRGTRSNSYVTVEDFKINGSGAAMQFYINPNGDGEISDTAPVGTLGAELLRLADLDFDFANRRLNLFSHDHCEGQVVHWQAQAVAVVPFEINRSNHIVLPVTVDGRRVYAMLDTGASTTTMNLRIAKRVFDVDITSAGVEHIGELEGGSFTSAVYRKRFDSIDLEGLTIRNPMVMLLPDMMDTPGYEQPGIGSLVRNRNDEPRLPDLIIGMSTLSKVHLYIAYSERRLYITPADQSAIASP